MFTTPPRHGPSGLGFTNGNTKIRAEWLNYVGGSFANALDAIGGGYYQLGGADLELSTGTCAFKLNFPDPSHAIELRGYVTIGTTNDPSFATGQGTLTVASAATFNNTITANAAVTYSNTVAFNGAVTFNNTITTTGNIAVNGNPGTTATTSANVTLVLNGPTTVNNTVTLNQPIQQTGANGFVSPSHEDIAAPAVNFNIDGAKNIVFIGAQTVDVVGTLTYTGGGLPRVIRVVSQAMSPGFKIDFNFVAIPGTTLATFPSAGSRAWVDFYYNGLTWEVAAYGGGTIVY
jgi:hypothetical protein